MHVAGHAFNLMSFAERALFHHSALQILQETGMEVQNQRLLQALADVGAQVDLGRRSAHAQRARFPPPMVERFLAEAVRHDWEHTRPRVGGTAGVYHGLYRDPASGELVPWDEEKLATHFALARHLEHVDGTLMLGCRLPVTGALESLYECYYCWKYGASDDEVCSPIQMILDNEWMGAMKRFTHEFEITPEAIGLETILKAGPGGHYLDELHTVRRFRDEHWDPGIWSRQMLGT
jgi:hypothetical protein